MSPRLEHTLLDMMDSLARNMRAQPLNLGGVAGAGGGLGGPPGGFIGKLPQTNVAYDTDELASSGIVGSGTLLDNLNHIRYRIEELETYGILVVDEIDGSPSISNVTRITFSGGATVTDDGNGRAIVSITASGGGGGISEAPTDGEIYGRQNSSWVDLDLTYLRLDTGNIPLTGTVWTNSLEDSSFIGVQNVAGGNVTSSPALSLVRNANGTSPFLYAYYGLSENDSAYAVNILDSNPFIIFSGGTLRHVRYDSTILSLINPYAPPSGNMLEFNSFNDIAASGRLLSLKNQTVEKFSVNGDGGVNIAIGQTYDIDGIPHTHDNISSSGVMLSAASPRIYIADDTWTMPSGLVYIIIEICAAGGGGGGALGNATGASCANGGGAGEYAKKKILAEDLGSTETVTVGVGGSGGAAGNNAGSSGEDTSFGAHLSAVGGTGGNGSGNFTSFPSSGTVAGGTGGSGGSGGGIRVPGSDALPGVVWTATGTAKSKGGGNPLAPFTTDTGTFSDDTDGATGRGYGGGGSGGRSSSNSTSRAGGDGADGVVIVWEYISA